MSYRRKRITAGAGALIGVALMSTANAQVFYVYQGTDPTPKGTISAYTGAATGAGNYNYSSSSENLLNGPTLSVGAAHLFMYAGSDGLHFNVVFSRRGGGANGDGSADWGISLTGNGVTASAQVEDDNNELGGGPTSFTGGWDWNNANSDGGVIGPLSGPLWSLTVTPMTTTKGYSGGIAAYSSDGSSLPLAYGTGSDYAITITPVPEPGEYVAIVAAGLLGLASWRRWRRT